MRFSLHFIHNRKAYYGRSFLFIRSGLPFGGILLPMSMNEFVAETGTVGETFLNMCKTTAAESVLDEKTFQLVYLAYLTAIKQYGGLEVHTKILKKLGATREEVQGAILCGLPALGVSLMQAHQVVMDAYDSV